MEFAINRTIIGVVSVFRLQRSFRVSMEPTRAFAEMIPDFRNTPVCLNVLPINIESSSVGCSADFIALLNEVAEDFFPNMLPAEEK